MIPLVEDKYKYKCDSYALMASLRYAIGKPTLALAIFRDNLKQNLHELPDHDLKLMKEELTEYYRNHTDDMNYCVANEIVVMIKHELWDE